MTEKTEKKKQKQTLTLRVPENLHWALKFRGINKKMFMNDVAIAILSGREPALTEELEVKSPQPSDNSRGVGT